MGREIFYPQHFVFRSHECETRGSTPVREASAFVKGQLFFNRTPQAQAQLLGTIISQCEEAAEGKNTYIAPNESLLSMLRIIAQDELDKLLNGGDDKTPELPP